MPSITIFETDCLKRKQAKGENICAYTNVYSGPMFELSEIFVTVLSSGQIGCPPSLHIQYHSLYFMVEIKHIT